MEASLLDWSKCTPTYFDEFRNEKYNVFKSPYKNIRFTVKEQGSYTIKADDIGKIAMISYRIYGTTIFWRALLEYNGFKNPVSDIYPGQVLKIPDKDSLVALFSNPPESQENSISNTLTV